MTTDAVDDYIAAKVTPELQPVVAELRALMKTLAPKATLAMSYGQPMWKGAGYLAWITPAKGHISLGFTYGGAFEDKYALLKGVGKHARHLKFKSVEDIKPAQLRYYVKQALARDKLG
jgi:hypothetical protein